MSRENFFIKKFSKNIGNFSNSEKIQEFIQSVPRFVFRICFDISFNGNNFFYGFF